MIKSKNTKIWILAGLLLVIACGSAAYNLGLFEPPAAINQEPPVAKSQEPSTNASANIQSTSVNSKVAIVQSKTADVKDIKYDEIKAMVNEAVELAGGFSDLVKDGSTVVIKPNLVTMNDYCLPNWQGRPLAAEANGTTTDWRLAKAVVELVRKYNPTGKVYVMEGSSSDTKKVMEQLKYTPEYIPGVDEFLAIEEDSGAWHDYNSDGIVKVGLPNGLLHKEYYLNKKYKEADVLISLPCLKNHWNAAVTGSIKNVGIGATPGSIYGIDPANPGRNNMVNHETADLHKWIHDFYLCRPVDYVIMDGLQGIQNGPTPSYAISGTDRLEKDQMNMRLVLAGKDPVAVDTIESLVMNWDPQSVKYLELLAKDGAGITDTSRITVEGRQVDEVRKDFAGVIPAAGGAKVTDGTPPEVSIGGLSVKNGILSLSIDKAEDAVKAEVYVDGKLSGTAAADSFKEFRIDIGGTGKGTHEVRVWTFDRFLNRTENIMSVENDVDKAAAAVQKADYTALRAQTAPVVDGKGSDECWRTADWADINSLWLGEKPSPDDFSGRYKIVWTPEKLYYLVEITDDVLSGAPPDPLVDYYKYDTLELFMDEDRSGGDHAYSYNAFAYHISVDLNVADLGTDKKARLFNKHLKVSRTSSGNVYTWEAALDVYSDKYDENSDNNIPVVLSPGKQLGYALAYCDNDGGLDRESFIGSKDIPGSDKNVAWQNADVFGLLRLE